MIEYQYFRFDFYRDLFFIEKTRSLFPPRGNLIICERNKHPSKNFSQIFHQKLLINKNAVHCAKITCSINQNLIFL